MDTSPCSSLRRLCLLLALTATLTACAQPATEVSGAESEAAIGGVARSTSESPTSDAAISDGGIVEADTAAPRLLVADADHATVHVIDLSTGARLSALPLDGPAQLAATEGGRYVLAGQGEEDAVAVIDGGSWVVPHGDHSHYNSKDAEVVTSIAGRQPSHLVSHGDHAAIFFDSDGVAEIIDLTALDDGNETTIGAVDTGAPHHGVAVAFAGHVLATIPADEEDALPIGVTVRHDGDEIEAELRDCPELHGEVATQTMVAFACDDGVMTVTDDGGWHSAKIDYPSRDGRLWTLAGGHGHDWAAGALSQSNPPYGALSSVAIIDFATGSATSINTPAPVLSVAVDPATGSVIALQTDGALSRLDPSEQEVLATTEPIVEPFTVDYERTLPSLVVAGGHAYVSDPAAATVTELHIADALEVEDVIEVDATPASIAVVGTG